MAEDNAEEARITVFIVDDHDVVRKGLRFYLSARQDVALVGEAGDAFTAVAEVVRRRPDVVLMDLVLPMKPGDEPTDQGGIYATRRIREHAPQTQIVVLTSYLRDELIFAAIRAGAISYLLKDADADTVLQAIHAAMQGEAILHPRVARRLIAEVSHPRQRDDPLNSLSAREMEVLKLVAQGHTNAEIAARLFITERTVKSHVSNILSKLHLSDRTQAAIYAWRRGLMEDQTSESGELS